MEKGYGVNFLGDSISNNMLKILGMIDKRKGQALWIKEEGLGANLPRGTLC